MKIAILGWGSLIGEKRDIPIDKKVGWKKRGPKLPLEFARLSKSRCCILTLVIYPEYKKQNEFSTRYAISERENICDAICDLAKREGTTYNKIGYVDIKNNSSRSNIYKEARGIIKNWAKEKKFNGVVWTDLRSNFKDETGKNFSIETALDYLHNLPKSLAKSAREYIKNAPQEVNTPLRQRLKNDPWFSNEG